MPECLAYCNQWTCDKIDCLGCQAPICVRPPLPPRPPPALPRPPSHPAPLLPPPAPPLPPPPAPVYCDESCHHDNFRNGNYYDSHTHPPFCFQADEAAHTHTGAFLRFAGTCYMPQPARDAMGKPTGHYVCWGETVLCTMGHRPTEPVVVMRDGHGQTDVQVPRGPPPPPPRKPPPPPPPWSFPSPPKSPPPSPHPYSPPPPLPPPIPPSSPPPPEFPPRSPLAPPRTPPGAPAPPEPPHAPPLPPASPRLRLSVSPPPPFLSAEQRAHAHGGAPASVVWKNSFPDWMTDPLSFSLVLGILFAAGGVVWRSSARWRSRRHKPLPTFESVDSLPDLPHYRPGHLHKSDRPSPRRPSPRSPDRQQTDFFETAAPHGSTPRAIREIQPSDHPPLGAAEKPEQHDPEQHDPIELDDETIIEV